jgi:O-antigen/teichoic acid export membrane protein
MGTHRARSGPPVIAHLRANSGFVRMFSSAVMSQVLLSAGNFLIGLVLIRQVSDLQYGYYMLFTNGLLLAVALENAWIGPFVVRHAIHEDKLVHARFLGNLYAEQRRWLLIGCAIAVALVLALTAAGVYPQDSAAVTLFGLLAALAVLDREYFRIALLSHRQAERVLRADIVYVVVVLLSAVLATRTPHPVLFAISGNGIAAAVGSLLMRRQLRAHIPWKIGRTDGGAQREFASSGMWSLSGAGIHWLFAQSYSYLVTAVLGVAAVAALGATRLLMMPVNLLSSGIRSQMMPVTSRWLIDHGAPRVLARLIAIGVGMATLSLCYFLVMWLARDWLFTVVLKKHIADRDTMLLLWSAIFLLMVIRDQLIYLPLVRARFRALSLLTLACALASIAVSYIAMRQYGQIGALFGTLAGEVLNLIAVGGLCWQEARRDAEQPKAEECLVLEV